MKGDLYILQFYISPHCLTFAQNIFSHLKYILCVIMFCKSVHCGEMNQTQALETVNCNISNVNKTFASNLGWHKRTKICD